MTFSVKSWAGKSYASVRHICVVLVGKKSVTCFFFKGNNEMYCRELNGPEKKNSGTKKLLFLQQIVTVLKLLIDWPVQGSSVAFGGGVLQPIYVMHLCVLPGSKHSLHYTTFSLQSTSFNLFLLLLSLFPIKYLRCVYVCLALVVYDDVLERLPWMSSWSMIFSVSLE